MYILYQPLLRTRVGAVERQGGVRRTLGRGARFVALGAGTTHPWQRIRLFIQKTFYVKNLLYKKSKNQNFQQEINGFSI